MRSYTVIIIALCLLGWQVTACQVLPPTPTRTPPPTGAWTPTPTRTLTPAPSSTPSPTPTPSPLTEAEAIALVEKELAARDVELDTMRFVIRAEPRAASVRYASTYDLTSSVFRVQTTLIALAVSRVMLRVQPPIDGGISLSVLPEGNVEVGLVVIAISQSSLDAWAGGSISDEEFVGGWMVGVVPQE